MTVGTSLDSLSQQDQLRLAQGQRSPESFWSMVLKKHSSNKLSRLLTAWVQESVRPTDEPDNASAPPLQMDGLAAKAGEAIRPAKESPMTQEHSSALDAPYAEYAYHKEDAEGTPRTDSPDDVIATVADMRRGEHPPASAHAPPPPNPPPDAEAQSEMTSPELHVGETPSTAVVFQGEREFPDPEATRRTVPAARNGAGAATAPTAAGMQTPAAPNTQHRRDAASMPASPCRSTPAPAAGSASEPASPAAHVRNVKWCSECQSDFTGPSFMLNDRAYCCQRHRLLAYHKFERGQIDHPGFRSTDEPDRLLATGVRASFRAWI